MKFRIFFSIIILSALALTISTVKAQTSHNRNLLSGTYSEGTLWEIYSGAQKWAPYPFYRERDKWQALPADVKETAKKAANNALDFTWPVLPAALYLEYSRNGNRSNYEGVYFERRRKLSELVIGEMIEGNGKYLDQIVNGIWAICEESSWCIPAHIYSQKGGTTPLPRYDESVVDLFAAETGTTLTWTYYLLKDELDKITPVIAGRIEYEINKRILTPVMERDDFWWMGLAERSSVNNWNPWIISNWITCDLVMEKDPARKVRSLSKALVCLDKFLNAYPDDGGCDEGPGYWGVAGGSLFDCLELLYSSSNGRINIYDNPLVKNIGSYIYKAYISGSYFINFADASAKITPDYDVVYRFGKSIQDKTMMGFGAFIFDKTGYSSGSYMMGRSLNTIFSVKEISDYTAAEPLVGDFWLPETQVYGARSAAGTVKGLFIAGKGGHNAESHNHNDVGNFIVYMDGRPAIIDVGVGQYRRETFSNLRYTIWTMQSQYHNLPTVNGVMQKDGRNFQAKNPAFSADSKSANFMVDISGAYPAEAGINSWKRTVNFLRGKSVRITEDFNLKMAKDSTFLTLMTPCEVTVQPGTIKLQERNSENLFSLNIAFSNSQLTPVVEKIAIIDPRLKPIWGEVLFRIKLVVIQNKPAQKILYTINAD